MHQSQEYKLFSFQEESGKVLDNSNNIANIISPKNMAGERLLTQTSPLSMNISSKSSPVNAKNYTMTNPTPELDNILLMRKLQSRT